MINKLLRILSATAVVCLWKFCLSPRLLLWILLVYLYWGPRTPFAQNRLLAGCKLCWQHWPANAWCKVVEEHTVAVRYMALLNNTPALVRLLSTRPCFLTEGREASHGQLSSLQDAFFRVTLIIAPITSTSLLLVQGYIVNAFTVLFLFSLKFLHMLRKLNS